MTGIEQGHSADENPTETQVSQTPTSAEAVHQDPAQGQANSAGQADSQAVATQSDAGSDSEATAADRRRILIGSQRDPAAYRARRQRDWIPIEGDDSSSDETGEGPEAPRPGRSSDETLRAGATASAGAALADVDTCSLPRQPLPPAEPLFPQPMLRPDAPAEDEPPVIPGRRQKLTTSMEAELDRAMGGLSLDDLMSGGEGGGQEGALEPESRHRGRVVALRRDEVFVEFGGREQGSLSARSFETPPQPGESIEVVIQRFNAEEGLYDLSLPGVSVELGNWEEVREGMLVDAQVTGHNTGGLECEVNRLRGFIPVSQVSLYRVEDLAQFVGQRFTCLISEANPARKNLVLSRRAVLEREKAEKKESFFASLAAGQVFDGTVRKLMDFGAFVELGNGVDGLLHVSQLSWGRIKHPSEVLQEGQAVRVRIEKIDRETGRIGLSYREMTENPWTGAAAKYRHNSVVRGKVARLMDFGAFVELEPGIEGLVHISELSHKRIWRASDVVKEGEEIEVLVLNVNPEAQRMSLSIKGLSKPEPTKKEKDEAQEAEQPVEPKKASRRSNQPLKGGLGKSAGGESVGLKW